MNTYTAGNTTSNHIVYNTNSTTDNTTSNHIVYNTHSTTTTGNGITLVPTATGTSSGLYINQNGTGTSITITNSGSGISVFSDDLQRRVFCAHRKHRMYRAIGETCPCFKDAGFIWGLPIDNDEGFFEHEGIQYYINKEGLARGTSEIFDQMELQEELIHELREEITRLRSVKA